MLCLSNVCCPWTSLYQLSASSRSLLSLPTEMWQLKNTSQLESRSPTMHRGAGQSNQKAPQNIQFPAWPLEGELSSPTKLFKCADFATKINTLTVWNHSNSFENTHHQDPANPANVTQPLSTHVYQGKPVGQLTSVTPLHVHNNQQDLGPLLRSRPVFRDHPWQQNSS